MDEELKAVFDLATDRGINLWDTADSYGTENGSVCCAAVCCVFCQRTDIQPLIAQIHTM